MGIQSDLNVFAADTIHEFNKSEWNQVVNHADLGTVFHSYEWLSAIEGGLDYPARHVVVTKNSNIIGLWPNFIRRLYNTPFNQLSSTNPGFGGPIATTNVEQTLSLFLESVPTICNGRNIMHEVRVYHPAYVRFDLFFKNNGYVQTRDGCRFVLNLSDRYDHVWNQMSKSRRKQIKQSRDLSYTVELAENPSSYADEFYRTYKQVMTRINGDMFPRTFVDRLLDLESRVLLFNLEIAGEFAGSMLELRKDENSTIHGFLAAIPEESFEYNASEILYDAIFKWGIENGYDRYDFGYTEANFANGIFQYKESFGGDLVPNIFWERGYNPIWSILETGRQLYWNHIK